MALRISRKLEGRGLALIDMVASDLEASMVNSEKYIVAWPYCRGWPAVWRRESKIRPAIDMPEP